MPRPRLIPIFSSFAIVLAAYWLYALGVVRLIEPEADSRMAIDGPGEPGSGGPRELKGHFAEGAWELDEPKILESKQVMLLFGDYVKQDKKKVLLRPCTMIFTPEEPGLSFEEQTHRAVILEAPEGALMEFDSPLELHQAKIGRLVNGRLNGPVVIRSKGKLPGPEDDLRIETREVALSEKEVTTPHPLRFRWGANYGSGRGLVIKLAGDDKVSGHGPNVKEIESLTLESVDRIHLEFARKDLPAGKVPAARTPPGPAPRAKPKEDDSGLPVEITCAGPFRLNLRGSGEKEEGESEKEQEENVASFQDQVDVWRIHPDGPSDHLSCERLSIYLAPKKKTRPGGGGKSKPGGKDDGPLDLEPHRIKALGSPVVVHAPSQSVQARGDSLEYNLRDGRMILAGREEAMLRQGPNEIHAPSLQYEPAASGRLGKVRADGPGWLVGQSPDKPDDQLEARWKKQLQVRPQGQNHVISLTGGADLYFRGVGRLAAEEIHFWLIEKPADKKSARPALQPDRMMARNNVRIHHPQLDGAVGQMEVWFHQFPPERPKREAPGPVAVRKEQGRGGQAGNWFSRIFAPSSWDVRQTAQGAVRRLKLTTARQGAGPAQTPPGQLPTGLVPPVQAPRGQVPARAIRPPQARPEQTPRSGLPPTEVPSGQLPPPATDGAARGKPPASRQHFDIVGELLRAQIMVRGRTTELSELTVEGNVRLIETETQRPGERPMLVTGDRLHVVDAGKPYAAVAVTGRLAHFEARGLALNGSNINLNRGTNRLWIDGSGWMNLPMDRDPQGRPVRDAGPLEIHWQDSMDFDGRTVRFEDSVVATSRFHHMRTETLEVSLSRPIRFGETKTNVRPEIQQIVCRGGAYMENRSQDAKGQASIERIRVGNLAVDMHTGAVTAQGPGWVRTTRRGSAQLLDARRGTSTAMHTARRPVAENSRDDSSLTYVGVDFQRSLSGNLHRREMTFLEQVRTVYGPVDEWDAVLDPDKPEALGTGGAVLSCDQLAVAEIAVPNRQQRAMELVATGNTLVEAAGYTARASRLSYAEAKDLLILEGDGRTDAELYRQERIGSEMSRFNARKIFFWPSTNRLNIDSGSLVEVNESSNPKPPQPPRQAPPADVGRSAMR